MHNKDGSWTVPIPTMNKSAMESESKEIRSRSFLKSCICKSINKLRIPCTNYHKQ